MSCSLLNCLARAVVKHGLRFLVDLAPGGAAVYDMAVDVYDEYRRRGEEDGLRAEVAALAHAPAEQVQRDVEEAVRAAAAGQPEEVQHAIADYLAQVPAAIRRSLRRPSDPSGTTVPATRALAHPEDLMQLLPPRPPRFKPGDRPLPGVDWVLEELVGIGGFGEVWKARHAHLRSKAPVALKFCLDRVAMSALRNEAGVLDRVMRHGRHPGIVPLLNTYLSADPPCLEYEYVDGGDLAGLIQELHARGSAKPDLANRLLLRLAEIVAVAHRIDPAIVHGDLKPANILVRRGADGKIALRVTDFGIGGVAAARAIRETRQPSRSRQELLTDAVRGAYTPLYASRQQMARRPGEAADPRDDVHALGVIWYQLLTGDLAMLSIPPDWKEQVERRGLNAGLTQLLGSCFASDDMARPASAAVLAKRLRSVPPPPDEPKRKPSPAPKLIAAAVVALVVLWAGWSIFRTPSGGVGNPQPGNKGGDLVRNDNPPPKIDPPNPPPKIDPQPGTKVNPPPIKFDPPPKIDPPKLNPPPKIDPQPGKKAGDLVINPLGMKFAWCPPGNFLMGSPAGELERGNDETQHRVTLTKGFYLGIHPVTQAQWQAVMLGNPSHFKGDQLPVEEVSWEHCQEFCKKLGQEDGKRYRLPTEAEWEYACRAGSTTPFHFGETISTDQVNYNGNFPYGQGKKGEYREKTTPVGSFPPNAWGLYDIHGNVYQWCQDWYGPYPATDVVDPRGPGSGDIRMLRGGSWYALARSCRSAYRHRFAPGYLSYGVGCRVVCCLD